MIAFANAVLKSCKHWIYYNLREWPLTNYSSTPMSGQTLFEQPCRHLCRKRRLCRERKQPRSERYTCFEWWVNVRVGAKAIATALTSFGLVSSVAFTSRSGRIGTYTIVFLIHLGKESREKTSSHKLQNHCTTSAFVHNRKGRQKETTFSREGLWCFTTQSYLRWMGLAAEIDCGQDQSLLSTDSGWDEQARGIASSQRRWHWGGRAQSNYWSRLRRCFKPTRLGGFAARFFACVYKGFFARERKMK